MLVVPGGTREVFHGEWEYEGREDDHIDFVTDDLARFVGEIADAIGAMTLAQAFLAAGHPLRGRSPRRRSRRRRDSPGFCALGVDLVGYAFAIYFLALTVKTMPVGIVYAVWSGAGIVLIAAIAWIVFRQAIDTPGLIGIGMILAGVLVVNLFSKTVGH